jgi:hypothetical protein
MWLSLLYSWIIITMSMKVGMKVGRSDDYHQKKEWIKGNKYQLKKVKKILKQHNKYG